MQNITIRRLTPLDAAAYRECRLESLKLAPTAFASSYEEEDERTLEEMSGRFRENAAESATFGAFDGDKLVGLTGFYREERLKRRHKGNIVGVFVRPEYRGRGIGRMVVSAAIEYARTVPGVERLELAVASTNEPAKALYESLGFVCFGTEPDFMLYEGKHYDEDYMSLKL